MFALRKMFIGGKYKNKRKSIGIKDNEFMDYLTVVLKNFGFTQAGIFNDAGEVKRLLRTYFAKEIKAKEAKMK